MNTLSLSISNTPIRQDSQGNFCLNDLHKAAGNDQKYKPANFLRLDSTKAMAAEINRFSDMRSAIEVVNGGKTPGTYVAKELVYAYAMWVSPAFSLQVIRTFDAVATHTADDELVTMTIGDPNSAAVTYKIPEPPAELANQLAALQAEILHANPQLQDVLNLSRIGYSQARIGEMLGINHNTVFRVVRRLRSCGFDTAPVAPTTTALAVVGG